MADKVPVRAGDGPFGLRRKKSFQGHQYRRKTKPISEQYRAELSEVLGFTVKNNCAFACNEVTGNIAFPAGCVIVVCQVRKNKQFHIFNPGHKSLTCIQISIDGQNIVTGESGHLPCVRVFSVLEKCQVASFQSHKFGISCVAFSPNLEYIISVGYQHDQVINVWNWRKNALAASNKVSVKVRAVAFAEDSSYFVSVGNRHVKFWYIEKSKVPDNETVPLKGRSGLLSSVRNQLFCDVACGIGGDNAYTYALTRTAMLCQFNEKRTLENSVQLQATSAFCMHVANGTIVCGCGEGKVLLHSASDLQILSSFVSSDKDSRLNDLLAVSMDGKNMWVHCVHDDHTIRVWDLIDFNCPVEHSSCSFHSDCIWDIKGIPSSEKTISSFYSCSNDSTVKLWEFADVEFELRSNLVVNSGSPVTTTPSNPKTGKAGIRTLCVSQDARFLAVGDRNGVIHIYETDVQEHKRTAYVDMHSGDILGLAFNASNSLLASASRDRCIYILDAEHTPKYTINDHSAAVTAVEFVYLNDKLRLISCGVDKSLYFCTVENIDGRVEVVRDQHIVEKHAMHDMTIVNDSVLVACGANLREYDIDTGKSQRFIRGCESLATILRVTTGAESTIIAISCSDKFVYLLNYPSGECLLELGGHSEVCTALVFLNTVVETTLVTASADSCMFAWKLARCTKIDDAVLSFQSQLSPHLENDQCEDEDTDINEMSNVNTTAFFGDPTLNGSILVVHTPLEDSANDLKYGGTHAEVCNNDMQDDAIARSNNMTDLDTSLPTWLTGKKDKVIKTKMPTGKWAGRFQDQYKDIVILDTPRTVMEWEDINGEDSNADDRSDDSEDAADEETLEVENKEENEINTLNGGCDNIPSELDKYVHEEGITAQADTSATLSTDYVSAIDESYEEKMSPRTNPAFHSEKTEIIKSEVAVIVNGGNFDPNDTNRVLKAHLEACGTVNDCDKSVKKEQNMDSKIASNKQPAIPPAFADLIENLSKKKARTLPSSLPVKSSYGLKKFEQARSTSEIASFLPMAVIPHTDTVENIRALESNEEDLHMEECQEVVGNLMSAYEQAESMYQRVSGENHSGNGDAHSLLSGAFVSLKNKIDQLQLKISREQNNLKMDIDNLPPVLTLLREYSDKLCSMVKEEIRKSSVINE